MKNKALLVFAFIYVFFPVKVKADSFQERIINEIYSVSATLGLNADLMLSIALHESNLNPYAMNIATPFKYRKRIKNILRKAKVIYSSSCRKNKCYFSIYPKTETSTVYLIERFYTLHKKGFIKNADLGLFQISSMHLKTKEDWYKAFNIEFALKKARQILLDCSRKFQNTMTIIECYNAGRKARSRNVYSRKILKIYTEVVQ